MSGTFGSFGTALSALRYNRVAMDVASGNIANVGTDGYTRQKVDAASVDGPVVPASWSRYEGAGNGVQVSGVSRMSDELLNVRSRREHGNQSYLDVRQSSLERLENGIGEPGDSGLSATLQKLRSAFHDLANNPTSSAARATVLSAAGSVVDAVKAQARNIDGEMSDQGAALVGDVAEANNVAQSLAQTNAAIASGTLNGDNVNTLLDKRDQLTLRISQLTGASASLRPDGGADVTLGGVSLVSGNKAGTLAVASGVGSDGTVDGQPVTFAVTDASGTTATLAAAPGGEIGGIADLVGTTLPTYRSSLAGVAKSLADLVNTQQQAGYDASGNAGKPLFSYSSSDVLGSLSVAINDPALLAASSVAGNGVDGGNADTLATMPGVEGDYQTLVTGLGAQVTEAQRRSSTQQVLTDQTDSARDQLAGVDTDEEMVNLLAAQRGYEAASRVITTLDSVLDTLINRTGLTH